MAKRKKKASKGKQKKKPAHEVLIDKIQNAFAAADENGSKVLETLCAVLTNMLIPKDKLPEIIRRLYYLLVHYDQSNQGKLRSLRSVIVELEKETK